MGVRTRVSPPGPLRWCQPALTFRLRLSRFLTPPSPCLRGFLYFHPFEIQSPLACALLLSRYVEEKREKGTEADGNDDIPLPARNARTAWNLFRACRYVSIFRRQVAQPHAGALFGCRSNGNRQSSPGLDFPSIAF
jgi:hypothetical protein